MDTTRNIPSKSNRLKINKKNEKFFLIKTTKLLYYMQIKVFFFFIT